MSSTFATLSNAVRSFSVVDAKYFNQSDYEENDEETRTSQSIAAFVLSECVNGYCVVDDIVLLRQSWCKYNDFDTVCQRHQAWHLEPQVGVREANWKQLKKASIGGSAHGLGW